ncbi:alpha-glucan family phosphorylase [bacterium]|nr:MAG: alpha-glucan family phosphorylase [bacterium]
MTTQQSIPVAYFSAEYAIADDMPIYAGGLGVLAADIVLQAAAENRPFMAVGLVYHQAFSGNDLDQRPIHERLSSHGFEVAVHDGQRVTVTVQVADRTVKLQAWVKQWGQTSLVLLDTKLPENDPRDQAVCDHLYASEHHLAMAQEICLGMGGVAMVRALGFQPQAWHLNEGHTALAGLALALEYLKGHAGSSLAAAAAAMRPVIAGTKHTILPGAGLFLDWGSVDLLLGPTLQASGIHLDELKSLAGRPQQNDYSGTKLLVSLCGRQSGVSILHVSEEKRVHPSSTLIPITNGIFRWRWTTKAWDGNPLEYDDAKFWAVHNENRRQLIEHVRQQTGKQLNNDWLTVVWARRMAAYKRPELLVSDTERLAKILNNSDKPVQFIVAGQANPADMGGVELMQRIISAAKLPELAPRLAYLPGYNPVSAKFLVRGADVWLNTPIRGYEACGTSGMKASLNGALQLSTSDGWVDEVKLQDIGWLLPDVGGEAASQALYDILEDEVAPLFYWRTYGIPHYWIERMRANMKLVLEGFTTERMLAEYYTKLYEHA